jgi:hypothetical protein
MLFLSSVHNVTLSSKQGQGKGNGRSEEESLHAFLRDVSTPLSAVALHLETASRRLSRGEDPAKSIGVAKKELGKALDMFERGRTQILTGQHPPARPPRGANTRDRDPKNASRMSLASEIAGRDARGHAAGTPGEAARRS